MWQGRGWRTSTWITPLCSDARIQGLQSHSWIKLLGVTLFDHDALLMGTEHHKLYTNGERPFRCKLLAEYDISIFYTAEGAHLLG